MKATDLRIEDIRIGNHFIPYNGAIIQWKLEDFSALTEYDLDIDEVIKDPIPLTEQWLIDFGLSKRKVKKLIEYNEYSIRNDFELFCYIDNAGWCLIWRSLDVFIVKTNTVHGFQNIVKELTGKELTINK